MKKQRLIFAGLFVFLIWLFIDIFFGSNDKRTDLIKEYIVKKKDIAQSVHGSGQVFASQETLVRAYSEGRLLNVFCAEGDKVEKDALLVELDNSGILQEKKIAHAKYLQLKDAYEKLKEGPTETDKLKAVSARDKVKLVYLEAKKRFEDQSELFVKGFVSKKSLEAARQSYEMAENDWKVAEETFKENTGNKEEHEISLAYAEVQQAKENYETLSRMQENLKLKAPFSGTVIELMVTVNKDAGEIPLNVNENQPLFSLADMSKMIVNGFVFESDINKIKPGYNVVLMPPGTRKEIKGKLVFVSQKAKSMGNINRFEVRIDVLGEHDFLKYGMNIDFNIVVSDKKQVHAVPLEYIMRDERGDYVLKKNQDNALEKVYIEKGIDNKLYAEVISGLQEGDMVCYKVENYNN